MTKKQKRQPTKMYGKVSIILALCVYLLALLVYGLSVMITRSEGIVADQYVMSSSFQDTQSAIFYILPFSLIPVIVFIRKAYKQENTTEITFSNIAILILIPIALDFIVMIPSFLGALLFAL